MIQALGKLFLAKVLFTSEIFQMLLHAFADAVRAMRYGTSAIRMVLLKQIYFTGLEAARIIVIIAVIIGTVIIAQVVSLVGNDGSLVGRILVWVVLRELAPLLTAIVVIARSGTAIAAELGAMKINGEIDSIEMLGIPTACYLVMPRIVGVTVSIVVLTVYFVLTSFIGSFLVASAGWHVPLQQFIQGIVATLGIREIIVLLVKSTLFGLFVSSTCCWYGLGVGKSATEIPQAATKAVMTSLFSVFLLDGLITYLYSISFV